ncbi:MAG: tRNA lysidine(34) synthetase TilS [Clostridia bacterium]|nr:tRNA lysidine(34) synthetase TilS [Clostridia bacterium]
MINKVRRSISDYSMLKHGDRVTVGVSGGADSMSLLSILLSLKDEIGLTVSAVHINHGIRGEEAVRDENFVRGFCSENGIELTVFCKNIPEIAGATGESEEECGRRIRYECFSKVCGDGVIATAHTLSDSLETMVFNMLRGCTGAGLCGIPAKRDNIIRPLISCSRQDVEEYCRANSIPYITDSSNLQSDYSRNYIRNEIMPMFSHINPSYSSALERCQNALREDCRFIDKTTDEYYSEVLSDGHIDAIRLDELDMAVKSRIIYRYIIDSTGVSPENRHINLILDFLKKDGAVQLNSDYYIVSSQGKLFADKGKNVKTEEKWLINAEEGLNETPLGRITLICEDIENINFNKVLADNILESYVDYDKICGDVVIRSRMEGDKITLPSRNVTKSLKKLFTENKIPAEERNRIPVIADKEKVIWVWGVGYNKACSVDSKTKRILKIIGG